MPFNVQPAFTSKLLGSAPPNQIADHHFLSTPNLEFPPQTLRIPERYPNVIVSRVLGFEGIQTKIHSLTVVIRISTILHGAMFTIITCSVDRFSSLESNSSR